jgi:hypothetical protein
MCKEHNWKVLGDISHYFDFDFAIQNFISRYVRKFLPLRWETELMLFFETWRKQSINLCHINWRWSSILTPLIAYWRKTCLVRVEIKCQLDATDEFFYCRSYCLLNIFRAPLCPLSGAREYYTSGFCLSYLVLLIMGIMVPETRWVSNKIYNKKFIYCI